MDAGVNDPVALEDRLEAVKGWMLHARTYFARHFGSDFNPAPIDLHLATLDEALKRERAGK